MEEFKEELGKDTVNTVKEPSTFVRFMQVKYKCLLIFALTFLLSVLMLSNTVKDVMRDDESRELTSQMITLFSQIYYPNETVQEVFAKT